MRLRQLEFQKSRALRVYVLGVLMCLSACVLNVFTCLVCLRAYVLPMKEYFTFLCVYFTLLSFLRAWCAFLSYLLHVSIVKFKKFF